MRKLGASSVFLSVALLQGCCCPPGVGGFIPKGAESYYRSSSSVFEAASDLEVCKTASDQATNWRDTRGASAWVKEAKDRNLTLTDCHKIIFETATDKHVCRLAIALNGEWETNPRLIGWTAEANRWGFTAETCTQVMFSGRNDKSICTFSMRNGEWTTARPVFVNEAKRRGLSPAKCKSL
jgi:hypothetical protein